MHLISKFGGIVNTWIRGIGRAGTFLGMVFFCMFTPPIKIRRVMLQLRFFGWQSLSIVCLSGLFVGMSLGLQGYHTLKHVGTDAILGPMVANSLVRELGPVLAAVMVIARAGSALTAEIGIMRTTDQIDAIEMMGLNPLRYLVVPNMIAAIIAIPLLAAAFDVAGIYGGYLVAVKLLGMSAGTYFGEISTYLKPDDVMGGIYKSLSFGVIIAWICCYKGYTTRFGAKGVSRATTEAVVTASVLILIWNYFMTAVVY